MASLSSRLRKRIRAWAWRRHGLDAEPFTIPSRRIYIVPTRLGLIFSGMLFLMFLGSMNYANNLGLALTFVLGSIALVAMHHCQRNLAGLRIASAATQPVFAGQMAQFAISIESDAKTMRHEISAATHESTGMPVSISAHERAVSTLELEAPKRGRLLLNHIEVSTNYPFGLFRAWTHIHIPMTCIVYPKPAERTDAAPPMETDIGGAQDSARGDDDFAGLRTFHPGDSPRRIAWKSYARGQALQVKHYAGTAVTSHLFDWDSLPGIGTEARLEKICRWIEEAHAASRAYGLRIPGTDIPANVGNAHRQRCLTALALFGIGA
jgi:uncharacterized protein (DUF58 family)